MTFKHYVLVLLCATAASAMEHKQLSLQQKYVLQHHYNKQLPQCSLLQEKYDLDQQKQSELSSLSQEDIFSLFEHETQDQTTSVGLISNILHYASPVTWVRATFNTISRVFSSSKKPNVDWSKPFKIEKGQHSYTTEGGGKRYFVIRDDQASDVFDMDSHEKIICHKIETKIISETWNTPRTHYAVCETEKMVIYDILNNKKVVIPFETPQQQVRSSFWQNGDDIRYIAITADQIIIKELLKDKPIIIERKGNKIQQHVYKENIFGVIFDDKKCIFYDIKRDYQPLIELQAQDSISFEIFAGNGDIPFEPVWIDGYCKFFDMNTGKEIFSQPQTAKYCLFGVWNKQQNVYMGRHLHPKECNYLYDITNKKIYALFIEENYIHYSFSGFSPSEKYRQGCILNLKTDDAKFVVYDIEDEGKRVKSIDISLGRTRCRISSNDNAIALSKDKVVEIYDLTTGRGTTKDCDGNHFEFFGRHPRYYAWSLDEKTVLVYDALTTKDYKLDFNENIKTILFDTKYGHLLVHNGARMDIFDVARNTRVTSFELPVTIDRYFFSNDGKWLVIGSKENRKTLLAYDVSNNYKPVSDKPLTFDSDIIRYFFMPDQNELYHVGTLTSDYVFNLKQ